MVVAVVVVVAFVVVVVEVAVVMKCEPHTLLAHIRRWWRIHRSSEVIAQQ